MVQQFSYPNPQHKSGKLDRWWDMYEKISGSVPNLDWKMKQWLEQYRPGGAPYQNLPSNERILFCSLVKRIDLSGQANPSQRKNESAGIPALADGIGKKKTSAAVKKPKDPAKTQAYLEKKQRSAMVWVRNRSRGGSTPAIFLNQGLCGEEFIPDLALIKEKKRIAFWVKRLNRNPNEAQAPALCRISAYSEYRVKMPFEIEIIYSKKYPGFNLVTSWKHKLGTCAKIFSETGKPPSFTDKRERSLACWYAAVSDLYARGALPSEAAWLSENFGHILRFNQYLELARAIGEENIARGSPILEVDGLAKWRDDVRMQHAQGLLSPDIVSHFKECSGILDG